MAIFAQFFQAFVGEERSHPSKMVQRDSSVPFESSFRGAKDDDLLRLLLVGKTPTFPQPMMICFEHELVAGVL